MFYTVYAWRWVQSTLHSMFGTNPFIIFLLVLAKTSTSSARIWYWLIRRFHNRYSLWIKKKCPDVTSVYQFIFPRSPCFLFTAWIGCSQDSQGTHVATNRCAACKHWPGLTCVYPTTLLGHRCVPPHRPLKQISTLIARRMTAVKQAQGRRREIQWHVVILVAKAEPKGQKAFKYFVSINLRPFGIWIMWPMIQKQIGKFVMIQYTVVLQ